MSLIQTNTVFQGDVTIKGRTRNASGVVEPCKASIAVGDETANVINVAVQLQAPDSSKTNGKAYIKAYLSSDTAGDVLEATGPDAIAIGTNGTIFKSGGDSVVLFDLKSEVNGKIDLDITKSGADTFYLNLVMPNGDVVTSAAITFDATT
jgi:hypothetical protein